MLKSGWVSLFLRLNAIRHPLPGIYPLAAASLAFDGTVPKSCQASAVIDAEFGVDTACSLSLGGWL